MKRKIAFALVMAAAGGTWSCLSQGQDPFLDELSVPAPRTTLTRSSSGVTSAIADLARVQVDNSLDEKVAGLLRQLKSVEGVEREGFFAELKSYVGAQFDQRQEGKARELKALEEQLAKLKEIHNKRTQQRDKIVADRVQQIIREVDGLGWGTDSADFPKLRSTFSADRMFMAPAAPGVLPDFGGGWTGATIPPPQPASALPRRN